MTRGNLRSYQKEFIQSGKFGMFFDMGTGKTRTAYFLCQDIKKKLDREIRVLIFCPISVITSWVKEFEKWGDPSPLTAFGSQKKAKILETFPNSGVFVTNYEAFRSEDFTKAVNKIPWDVLILDESHKCKTHNSLQSKRMHKLSDGIKYKYLLSGTPYLNGYEDLWSQFRIADKNVLGENYHSFVARHFANMNHGKAWCKFPDWRVKESSKAYFREVLEKHAMRVLISECIELPPFIQIDVPVKLEGAAEKHYREMERSFVTMTKDSACTADILLVQLLRLQQINAGVLPTQKGEVEVNCPKIDALLELIQELVVNQKRQVIIWCVFLSPIFRIEKLLREKLKLTTCNIQGDQKRNDRQNAIDGFNRGDFQVCVANQKAGGVGIDLTAASAMIYFAKSYSLEDDAQSERRCYRGGSEGHDKILRYDLVCENTIDEDINEALKAKMKEGELLWKIKNKLR